MTGSNLWSDGNALARPLHDLFRVDVTTAIGRCTASGRAVDQLLRVRWAALQRAEARLAARSYEGGAGRPTRVTAMPHARAAQAPATG